MKPEKPKTAPPKPTPQATPEGIRRQRRHIKDLDGEDPLRGGVAD